MTSLTRVCRLPLALLAATVICGGPAAAIARAQDPQPQQPPSAPVAVQSEPRPADEQAAGQNDGKQDSDKKQKKVKRDQDKPVTLRGCLNGSMLEGVEAEDPIDDLTPIVRLFSKKDLKKAVKASNGHEVEVTGILKLPPRSPLSKKFGKTTVSVGVGDPTRRQGPNQQMAVPNIGTLDVMGFKSVASRCGDQR
jgi:hypothetical protein